MCKSLIRKTLLVSTLALAGIAAASGSAGAYVGQDGDLSEFPRPAWPYINVAHPEEGQASAAADDPRPDPWVVAEDQTAGGR